MLYNKIYNDSRLALKSAWSKSVAVTIIITGCFVFLLLSASLSINILLSFYKVGAVAYDYRNYSLILAPIISFVGYIILSPVFMGIKKFSYCLINGNEPTVKHVFYYSLSKKLTLKIFWLYLSVFIKKAALYLLSFLPFVFLLTYIFRYYKTDNSFNKNSELVLFRILYVFLIFLFLLGFSIARYLSSRYFLVSYIFLRNPNLSIKNIVKLSVLVTKNEKKNIIKFRFSKIPNVALSLLFLPILYTFPMSLVTNGIYCNYLIEKYRKSQG